MGKPLMHTVNFKYLPMTPNHRILDMGCGSGRHTAAAFDHDGIHAVGADFQPDPLQEAQKRLRFHENLKHGHNSHWSLANADVTSLPFKNECFDTVICSEVLEHIPSHRRAAKELLRVLKPNGHLVVSVPRRWPEAICWGLSHQYRHTAGGHIRIYTPKNLITLIQSEGASHWKTHYAHGLHTPFWWLKCLVGLDRDQFLPVKLYHRFLTWDLMSKPKITRRVEHWINPLMGKSIVLYFKKR